MSSTSSHQGGNATAGIDLARQTTPRVRSDLLAELFRSDFVSAHANQFDEYWTYYEKEVRKSTVRGVFIKNLAGVGIKTHQELIAIVRELRPLGLNTRKDVHDLIQKKHPSLSEEALQNLIDLLLRVWLMVNFRDQETQLQAAQTLLLTWNEKQTFADVVETYFKKSRWTIDAKDARLHPSFSVAFMVDICGLELAWTTSLADHLRLNRREKKLWIFPYKSFLAGHLDTYTEEAGKITHNSPLPEALLQETIWTLNLLFPHWDQSTTDLLAKHGQSFQRVGPSDGPPTLNLIEFEYWRDRLAELYDVVFTSPPASWKQLYRDRRNPQQFWTFWIALIILGLTVVSTIATIIQTCASIVSLGK